MNNNNINDSSSSSIFSSVDIQPNNSSSIEVSEIISSVDINRNNCISASASVKSGNNFNRTPLCQKSINHNYFPTIGSQFRKLEIDQRTSIAHTSVSVAEYMLHKNPIMNEKSGNNF